MSVTVLDFLGKFITHSKVNGAYLGPKSTFLSFSFNQFIRSLGNCT